MTRHRVRLFALVGSVALFGSSTSRAESSEARAQALFDRAKALMASGRYVEACPKLEESQRLDPASGTLLNLGDCYEHLGRTATAWRTFLDAAAASKAVGNTSREHTARDRAAALVPELSKIVFVVSPTDNPGLELRHNGDIVPPARWGRSIPVDPGDQTVRAEAPGKSPWELSITLSARTELRVEVPALEAPPSTLATDGATADPLMTEATAPPSPPLPTEPTPEATSSRANLGGWILFGAGAALAGGGGGLAYSQMKKAQRAIEADDRQRYDSTKTPLLLGNIAMGVGGAAAFTGLVLVLANGFGDNDTTVPTTTGRLAPWFADNGAGLRVQGAW